MALPAGRYGVTKNQLLKIKKLPMNTIKLIEDLYEKYSLLGSAAFKNSTSVVTESSDLVESGAVYDALGFGNKNLLDYKLPTGNYGTTRTDIANGINIKSSSELVWCNSYWVIPTIGKNTDATFSFDLDFVSGTFMLIVKGNNDGSGVATEITRSDVISSDQKVVISFNTGNYEYLMFSLYVTISTATIGEANVTNIQLEIGDTATAYEPYHESVSDSLAEKCDNSVIAPVENGSTASQAYAVGSHFIRNGAFCTVTSAISANESLVGSNKFTSGDVADELVYKNGNITFVSGFSSNTINVKQCGRVVSVSMSIYSSNEYPKETYYKIGQLTGVDFPSANIRFPIINHLGLIMVGIITTSGEVQVYNYTEAGQGTITFNATYII